MAVCLQNSDCVLIHRNTPADCVRPPLKEGLPTQCLQLLHGYGECRRGMIDMRKRFRGNKPVATSVELEAGGGRSGFESEEKPPAPMLYAGRHSYEREGGGKGVEGKGEEFERYTRNDGIEDLRKK